MPLAAGTRLGPYEIVSAIGAGGMGQVYRARDTRLDRTVAIKVLHESYGADPGRRERFEREAKLVASLDHPHICALHDVGRAGDIDYLVMPYLEGMTLADRVKAGPLPAAQALEIAAQIADALDRAHRRGIVHRDLKPGNVMLTKSGVRLLDFGLAFTPDVQAPDSNDAATRPAITQMGAILGTLPYMAPEQLAGQRSDARADIWAFGCVLYEMLHGRRPFTGDSDAALVSAIMSAAPTPSGAVPPISPAIDAVVAGALVKDRDERWQHMHDVRRALAIAGAAASGHPTAAGALAPPARSRGAIAAIAVLGTATIVLAWLAWRAWHGAAAAEVLRFDVDPVGNSVIATTADTNPYFAVSPDGAQIAFVAVDNGLASIWIKRLDHDAAEQLADTTGGASPFWSPDGRSIAFFAGGALKRKALDNSPAQTLCKVEGVGFNGAWSPAGVIIINEWGSHHLVRVPDAGGTPAQWLEGQVSYGYPSFLPDGRHFLFVVPDLSNAAAHAHVGSLDSTDIVPVAGVSSRAEYVNGRLVYWRDGSLVAQPFDLQTFQVSGEPSVITNGLRAFSITGFASFSASARTLVYQAGAVTRQLVWANRQGLESAPIETDAEYSSVRVSPDGSRIAISARDQRLGTGNLFIHEIARSLTRQLTREPGTENAPAWTPDGTSVVYAADRHGPPNLHMRSIDGSGPEVEVLPPSKVGPMSAGMFTSNGATLIYVAANEKTGYDIMSMAVDHHSPPVAIAATKGRENSPRITADDRWLAFASNESGRYEVYVQPLNDPRGRRQVSRDGGTEPRWRGDGKELYFVAGADRTQMMAVDVTATGGAIEPGVPRLLFVRHGRIYDFDVTKDGRQFLLISVNNVTERGTLSTWVNWSR